MICTRCNQEHEAESFHVATRRKDGSPIYRKYCRVCYKKVKDVRNNGIKKKFIEYKESLKCSDCDMSFSEKYWLCEFHHVDSTKKDEDVSKLLNEKRSLKRVMEEVKKCIPLCCNCHRTRHQLGNVV